MKQQSILTTMTKRFSMHRLIRLGITVAILACLLFPSVYGKPADLGHDTQTLIPFDFQGIISGDGDIRPTGNPGIQDYNLTDNWGGCWCDAEKTGPDTDDDLMCWAAAASNVLEWTGWGFVHHDIEGDMTNCDQMFEHFNDHWEDQGSLTNIGWMWWFNGIGGLPGDYPDDPPYNGGSASWSEVDVPGGGDFWDPPYDFDDYYHEYNGEQYTLQNISRFLKAGYGVALGIYPNTPPGGHAITCWGFRYNDTADPETEPENYYLGLYITDSDNYDAVDTIRYYTVFYNSGAGRWEFGGGYAGWHISIVFGLEKNSFLEPDLAIYKTAYPDLVMAGEELFYNITVVNENTIVGGVTAYNVIVTDTLPIGVTYISDTGGLVLVGGRTYSCDLGDIAPGESKSFTIKVLVDPDYVIAHGNTITNTATVTSDSELWESDLTNNEATVTSYVQTEADLSVIKICKPDTWVLAGEDINYTIIVENLGPSVARNVVVTDEIRSSDIFTVVSITAPGYVFAPSPPVTGQTITLAGTRSDTTMNPGERDIIQIMVRASTASGFVGEAQDINNLVIVESAEPDPDLSNNQAEQSINVDAICDLKIGKQDLPDPVYTGDFLKYTLIFNNTGPSTAVNVLVEDWLPAGVSVNSVTSSKGSCMAGVPGDPLRPTTCAVDSLLSGETATMYINVTVLKPDDLSLQTWILHNDARISSDTFDPDNSDNLATEDTTVISTFTLADLKVTKFVKPDTEVLAGESINYTIVVENLGPCNAYGVGIRDEIISSGEFNVVGFTCNRPQQVIDQMLGPGHWIFEVYLEPLLEPKGAQGPPLSGGRWTIQITIQANEAQDINNLVNVFTTEVVSPPMLTIDPDLSNNEAQCSIHVTAVADLELTKVDSPDPVYTDKPPFKLPTLLYTLNVTNNGPSTAVNIVLRDILPPGVTINSVTSSKGSCNAGVPDDPTRPTTCTIGSLAPGEYATMLINVTVRKLTDLTILHNDAIVFSDTFDPDNSDNIATTATRAGPKALLLASSVGEAPIGNLYLSLAALGLISLVSMISLIATTGIDKRLTIKHLTGLLKARRK